MKIQTLLDRIYRSGRSFEFGPDNRLCLCCEPDAKPLSLAQKMGLTKHRPEIVRRAWRAVDDAKDLIERASARSRSAKARQRRQETP